MFTGIVQEVGRLSRAWKTGAGRRLVVRATPGFSDGIRPGDSVMVNGCCQTVEEARAGSITFTAVPETLEKSTLGSIRTGRRINLERAVAAGQGLDGHLVMGHVDGVGEIRGVTRSGGDFKIEVACPPEYMRYVAPKGSVAIDGMSLTVVSAKKSSFTVALIPHTLKNTIADEYRRGSRVNLEMDIIARYVQRLADVS